MNINLTEEQSFVLLGSRYTFTEEKKIQFANMLCKDLNWNKIIIYAVKNKVIGLLWRNIMQISPHYLLKGEIDKLFRFYYEGNIIRNNILITEKEKLASTFKRNEVEFVPLKGAFLIPNIYKDYGSRTMNDLDILILPERIETVKKILSEAGYLQGDYDVLTGKVNPITRNKELLYKMKMNNLYAFKKKINNPIINFIDIDVCFNIDLKIRDNMAERMLKRSRVEGDNTILKPCDFFMHLCSHLYKEATNAMWIQLEKDIALIKFCDVREFYLRYMNKKEVEKLLTTILVQDEYKKAIYYTMFYLRLLYNDGYENYILNNIELNDKDFIYKFGENDYKDKDYYWKKDFINRVFSENNKDELPDIPNYKKYFE